MENFEEKLKVVSEEIKEKENLSRTWNLETCTFLAEEAEKVVNRETIFLKNLELDHSKYFNTQCDITNKVITIFVVFAIIIFLMVILGNVFVDYSKLFFYAFMAIGLIFGIIEAVLLIKIETVMEKDEITKMEMNYRKQVVDKYMAFLNDCRIKIHILKK